MEEGDDKTEEGTVGIALGEWAERNRHKRNGVSSKCSRCGTESTHEREMRTIEVDSMLIETRTPDPLDPARSHVLRVNLGPVQRRGHELQPAAALLHYGAGTPGAHWTCAVNATRGWINISDSEMSTTSTDEIQRHAVMVLMESRERLQRRHTEMEEEGFVCCVGWPRKRLIRPGVLVFGLPLRPVSGSSMET